MVINILETYVIHITKECNMECLYCYEKDKTSTYTKEEVLSFVDNIVKNRTNNKFNVEFLGGEPLLRFDLIKDVFYHLEENKEIEVGYYCITTNGTILDDEIIQFLKKNKKVKFAASMDGNKTANQMRITKDGKNSHDLVLSNLKKLLENDIICSVHIVSHPYNVAMLYDSIVHLYNNGIMNIDIGTIESTIKIDENYCKIFISQLKRVSDDIINGTLKELNIGLFNGLKPYSDKRSYIRDSSGKVIGETYGRSNNDITHKDLYNVQICDFEDIIGKMIYNIRKTVYDYHQKKLSFK